MRENIPSCILAPPPDPETMIRGSFCRVAASTARVSFSPTTEPMDPMMKLQRVGRQKVREPILVGILIQELVDSLDGCHGKMVVALGANLVVLVHLLAKERGAASIAAHPDSFRYPF